MSEEITRFTACERFIQNVKHSASLEMELVEATEKGVTVRLPWKEELVGNPETGVIHGGAIFAFMDQAGGLANTCNTFPEFEITPTIDMRVDHLYAPAKGKAIMCHAECYRRSSQVMFVRMTVYEEGHASEPVATGLATYMRMKLPTPHIGASK